jgi:hypothetical protein
MADRGLTDAVLLPESTMFAAAPMLCDRRERLSTHATQAPAAATLAWNDRLQSLVSPSRARSIWSVERPSSGEARLLLSWADRRFSGTTRRGLAEVASPAIAPSAGHRVVKIVPSLRRLMSQWPARKSASRLPRLRFPRDIEHSSPIAPPEGCTKIG